MLFEINALSLHQNNKLFNFIFMKRDIDEKIAIIKKRLENRSKESIISDICNYIDENNVEDIAWMFDIELPEDE